MYVLGFIIFFRWQKNNWTFSWVISVSVSDSSQTIRAAVFLTAPMLPSCDWDVS